MDMAKRQRTARRRRSLTGGTTTSTTADPSCCCIPPPLHAVPQPSIAGHRRLLSLITGLQI
ncbi:hypothetical protein DAI22_02g157300 [Oryza sativa Japonica Group]|nr:hypothetical protein DAI22_02g157300 [Oryza sativa Japonica Group]